MLWDKESLIRIMVNAGLVSQKGFAKWNKTKRAALIKIQCFYFYTENSCRRGKKTLIIALRKGLNGGFKYDTKHCNCSPIEYCLLYIKKLKATQDVQVAEYS